MAMQYTYNWLTAGESNPPIIPIEVVIKRFYTVLYIG